MVALERIDRGALKRYKNPDNDPRGPWLQGDNGTAKSGSDKQLFEITLPSGRKVKPPTGNYWRFSPATYEAALTEGRVYFGRNGDSMPVIKRYLSEVQDGVVPRTWWPADEYGSNQSAKRDHLRKLLPSLQPFSTPKPEQLLEKILYIATSPGDLVMDSFAGSGTTAAVAMKTKRNWIAIECTNSATEYCRPRLCKAIDGEQGGISKEVSWNGGGGFHFYRIGAPVFDESGAIRTDITYETLSAFVWYLETRMPLLTAPGTPLLGIHNGTAYYLLYNGILGDRRPKSGNVLTSAILADLPKHDGPKVVYGEMSRFGDARLEAEDITFKQIPYDVRMR